MTGTFKKFKAARLFDWLNINNASSISGQSWSIKDMDGYDRSSLYSAPVTAYKSNTLTLFASADDLQTYDPDKYTATGLNISFNTGTYMKSISNEYYLDYEFSITGGAEDTTINSIYFSTWQYINGSASKQFLLGAIYLDEGVLVPAGETVILPMLLKVD